MSEASPPALALACCEGGDLAAASALAHTLGLTLYSLGEARPPERLLELRREGLSLRATGPKAPGPLRVDFEGGAAAHRRRFGGGRGQLIARAVGLKGGRPLRILDGTAGLGGDAFVLATLGAELRLCERSPIVAALLQDGLARAARSADEQLRGIIARMELTPVDVMTLIESPAALAPPPEVVYLDPMFPARQKSAKVKKEMALLHGLLRWPSEAEERALLCAALETATHRVVVKRPRLAASLAGPAPQLQLKGKSCRFDIYPLRSLS